MAGNAANRGIERVKRLSSRHHRSSSVGERQFPAEDDGSLTADGMIGCVVKQLQAWDAVYQLNGASYSALIG